MPNISIAQAKVVDATKAFRIAVNNFRERSTSVSNKEQALQRASSNRLTEQTRLRSAKHSLDGLIEDLRQKNNKVREAKDNYDYYVQSLRAAERTCTKSRWARPACLAMPKVSTAILEKVKFTGGIFDSKYANLECNNFTQHCITQEILFFKSFLFIPRKTRNT